MSGKVKYDVTKQDVAYAIEGNVEVIGQNTNFDTDEAEREINMYLAQDFLPYIDILDAEEDLINDRLDKGYPLYKAVADVILDRIAAQLGFLTDEMSFRLIE